MTRAINIAIFCGYILIGIILLPFILLWSLLGWLFTVSPTISASTTFFIVTFLFAFSQLYKKSGFLVLEYVLLLPLYGLAFHYRQFTRIFKYVFFILILIIEIYIVVIIYTRPDTLIYTRIVCILLLFSGFNVSCVVLRLWLPVSNTAFLETEKAYIQSKCNRKVVHLIVSELGTIEVMDEFIEAEDVNDEISEREWRLDELDDNSYDMNRCVEECIDSKPVLVLLHGYAGANALWADCLSLLQRRFKVYCVELYGFGRSASGWGKRWEPRTIDQNLSLFCSALEKWRVKMKLKRFTLVAHSLGAHVACAYAMEHSGVVDHLVLASPIGVGVLSRVEGGDCEDAIARFFWDTGWTPMDVLRWLGPLGPTALAIVLRWRKTRVHPFSHSLHNDPIQEKLFAELCYQNLAAPAHAERCLHIFMTSSGVAKRPLITWVGSSSSRSAKYGTFRTGLDSSCKVSILYGCEAYEHASIEHGKELVSALQLEGIDAELYNIPQAGHLLHLDNPVDFADTVIEATFRQQLSPNNV